MTAELQQPTIKNNLKEILDDNKFKIDNIDRLNILTDELMSVLDGYCLKHSKNENFNLELVKEIRTVTIDNILADDVKEKINGLNAGGMGLIINYLKQIIMIINTRSSVETLSDQDADVIEKAGNLYIKSFGETDFTKIMNFSIFDLPHDKKFSTKVIMDLNMAFCDIIFLLKFLKEKELVDDDTHDNLKEGLLSLLNVIDFIVMMKPDVNVYKLYVTVTKFIDVLTIINDNTLVATFLLNINQLINFLCKAFLEFNINNEGINTFFKTLAECTELEEINEELDDTNLEKEGE